MISSVVTTAPDIYVLPPIDNNYTTGGSLSVKAVTAAVMRRGPVGRPFTITADNWQDICGKPLPLSAGVEAEGMRHIEEALKECAYLDVVRVIAPDAKFPVIVGNDDAEKDDPLTENRDLPFGQDVELGDKEWFAIWPVDGDTCENRRVVISDIDSEKKLFRLQFVENLKSITRQLPGESYLVSLDIDARDDEGRPAFVSSVLEERKSRFRMLVKHDADIDMLKEGTFAFDGGTSGGNVTAEHYVSAWALFRDPDLSFDLSFAAGCYEQTALQEAISIAEGKLAQFRFDAPPAMTEEDAVKWVDDLNLTSYQASVFHYPYKATDRWFGGKGVWGVSGAATAAKARCLTTPTGRVDVRGSHFTAAGEKRGGVNRWGVESLHPNKGRVSPDQLVKARINPVSKGAVIGDCLTLWKQENYLRFEHVGAILNDISHEFLRAARIAKFEPDGLTRKLLEELVEEICKKRVQSGALVAPRRPEDGDSPYQIKIIQREIDLWQVDIALCPTGVARRIAMQPILIR